MDTKSSDNPSQPLVAHTTGAPDAAACPFCGSTDTEPIALFGSQLSTAQYYCRACRSPFQRIKHDAPPQR